VGADEGVRARSYEEVHHEAFERNACSLSLLVTGHDVVQLRVFAGKAVSGRTSELATDARLDQEARGRGVLACGFQTCARRETRDGAMGRERARA
jgi:hypothetical protein